MGKLTRIALILLAEEDSLRDSVQAFTRIPLGHRLSPDGHDVAENVRRSDFGKRGRLALQPVSHPYIPVTKASFCFLQGACGSMVRPSLHCIQKEVFGREYRLAALPGIPGPKHQRRVHMLDDLCNGTMSILLWVFE